MCFRSGNISRVKFYSCLFVDDVKNFTRWFFSLQVTKLYNSFLKGYFKPKSYRFVHFHLKYFQNQIKSLLFFRPYFERYVNSKC